MLQRTIPSSGETIPVIGLGSWKKFDVGDHASERKDLTKILQLMDQHNATVIDSSPMYGRSEQVIGELTAETGLADKFFYATKVWTSGREEGIQQMNASFHKLKRKVVDLMQIHNLVDWQIHLKTLRQWKAEGLIRYIGITHYTTSAHPELVRIMEKESLDFVQVNYSIATRNAEKRLLPLALDKGVAVIINEPLEKGGVFGKVKRKSLPPWAVELGIHSWAGFFLKYIISHPAITCVIPATSDPLHMGDNIAAGEGNLPGEYDRKKMVDLYEKL